ncbi:MAG: helix-turn-helix domain-containing protein [Streptosporangiaceae bacterium]
MPHSDLPLHQITALVSGRLHRHVIGFQVGKLTGGPEVLRILTELAFALDAHDIPINYQRRRDLAAGATLIDDAIWARMIREAGMRQPSIAHARRYLYELLTGCNLQNAPPPYRITSASSQGRYDDFVTGMPAPLAAALTEHARRQLHTWGIGDEPLQWQPPATWVTATTWPGADPAATDPAPIHHGLLHEHATPGQIAAGLGISPGHLRQVLRRHPLPRPRRPIRYTLIPAAAPAIPTPGQQPGVIYLDPAWLREEYLTWQRSLNDIAAQIRCPLQTLNTFAHDHAIPVRPRGAQVAIASRAAPGHHPRDLPEPLRSALTGRNARRSLHRLLVITEYASIHQAARDRGIWPSTLYEQLARMEHACGGPLIHRSPRPDGPGALTPLGQLLCQQASDYLDLRR